MRLAGDADVVIENMRPGVLDRLGLGYEAVRLVGSGIRMSDTPPQMSLPPPAIGENTQEILAALGYGEEAIETWREKGVI